MRVGISLSLTGGGKGAAPIITATVEPTAYTYSDGDAVNAHPSFATLDNTANYSSTAGTISSVEWLVDGVDQAGTYTLSAGQGVVIRVTDSAANTRDWTIDASVDAVVPAQFNTNHWSLSNDGVSITLTVSTLPDDGGSALTDLEYKVNAGSYTSLGAATTGDYTITASEGDSVYLRAVNAVGDGPDSAAKTVPASGAQLDLNFASGTYADNASNTLLSDIATFSRSGNATMVDSAGTVKWAPHNYYGYSNSTFPSLDSADVTATADYSTGTDYGNSVRYVATSGGGNSGNSVLALPPGADLKLVFWVRRISGTFEGGYGIYDEANSGYLAGHGYATAWPSALVTGSWVKQEISFTTTSNFTTARMWVLQKAAYGSMDIEIAGIHIIRTDLGGMVDNPEAISVNSPSLVPTSGSVVYMPRENHHEWNGSSWVRKGLLLETDAATNLLLYSSDISNAAWVKTNATATMNQTGLDGVANSAGTLSDDSGGGNGFVAITEDVTVATSTTYTWSVYAKANGLSGIMMYSALFTTPGNVGYYFDLSSGTVGSPFSGGTGLTPRIEDVGGGWYRCSITFTTDATDTAGQLQLYIADLSGTPTITVARDGTSSVILYGQQFEAGSYPSSYIPTSGATATRAGETLSVNAAGVPWSTTAMSWVFEGEASWVDNDASGEVILYGQFVDGNNSLRNAISTAGGNTGRLTLYAENGGVIETADGPTNNPTGYRNTIKMGMRLTTTDLQAVDGGTSGTNQTAVGGTIYDYATNTQDLAIGGWGLSYAYNGTIQRLRMWDSDIGASQLETETT